MALFIPPVNFGLVEEDLFRSGEPTQLSFPFLERLRLRTVVCLAPDKPMAPFMNFVHDQGIEFVHLGIEGSHTPWEPMTEKVVITALDILLCSKSYPLLVMCHLGRHRTGTVVGCLRKVQRWNLNSILSEYRRYAGSKVRVMNEQFIELFDTDLVTVPRAPPVWLSAAEQRVAMAAPPPAAPPVPRSPENQAAAPRGGGADSAPTSPV